MYYDDLIQDTVKEVQKIFDFCDLDVNTQTKDFIKNSNSAKKKKVYSVYRKKMNDKSWKNNLNTSIRNMISSDLQKNNIIDFEISL